MSGLKPPLPGSQYLSSASAEWESAGVDGFWVKPLYEDEERGEKTMLMKVDPGAAASPHTHEGEFEQIYVLEGSFQDGNRTMHAGDYCCRAPDAEHGGSSREGALVMLIYTRREP